MDVGYVHESQAKLDQIKQNIVELKKLEIKYKNEEKNHNNNNKTKMLYDKFIAELDKIKLHIKETQNEIKDQQTLE